MAVKMATGDAAEDWEQARKGLKPTRCKYGHWFYARPYPGVRFCSAACRQRARREQALSSGTVVPGGRSYARAAELVAEDDGPGLWRAEDLEAARRLQARGVAMGEGVMQALRAWNQREGKEGTACPICAQRDCLGALGPQFPCNAQRGLFGQEVLIEKQPLPRGADVRDPGAPSGVEADPRRQARIWDRRGKS